MAAYVDFNAYNLTAFRYTRFMFVLQNFRQALRYHIRH